MNQFDQTTTHAIPAAAALPTVTTDPLPLYLPGGPDRYRAWSGLRPGRLGDGPRRLCGLHRAQRPTGR